MLHTQTMCWPRSSLSLIKSQCFVNEQFLCMCATYTISWQVGWCCIRMCWPCSSLSLIKSQCFVNKQFLCMCATYTISWQVDWCCVLKSCVDHAYVCHWSSHSALLTNSFFACVRPTPLAGRLADAAYSNHVLTMLKSVTDQVTVLC